MDGAQAPQEPSATQRELEAVQRLTVGRRPARAPDPVPWTARIGINIVQMTAVAAVLIGASLASTIDWQDINAADISLIIIVGTFVAVAVGFAVALQLLAIIIRRMGPGGNA